MSTIDVYKTRYSSDYREYVYEKDSHQVKLTAMEVLSSGRTKHLTENYKLVFRKGKDRFETQDFYPTTIMTMMEKNYNFLLFDRAIYRPGQTVYFKGLMINTRWENRSQNFNRS